MTVYDLYHTETGELIRSQDFAEPPVNPAGKPWVWQQQNMPASVGGIPARWHNGAWHSAPVYSDATHHAPVWTGTLQLVQSDDTRIIDWKGVNGWIILDAADVTAIAVSVGGHVQACFTREKEMLAAVTAAETTAALALIDPQAGTIDGAGGWPA
jgi:hypothetical protein